MTTVQNYIKELLFEQDCVVIPDFGGFVTNFDCAKINLTNRFISPPQKWLAFNSLLKNDDGLLTNYIAREEKISLSQANLKVKAFVEDAKKYLSCDTTYLIDGLGTFSMNDEDKIQFQPKVTNNFYSESFGMENVLLKKNKSFQNELEVVLQPKVISNATIQQVFASDDREPMAEVIDEDKNAYQKGRFSKILPYVYGTIASIGLFAVIYFFDNQKSNLSSLNPFQSQTVEQIKAKSIPVQEPPIASPTLESEKKTKPIAEFKTEIINNSISTAAEPKNRFFVITGSFESKRNAKKLLNSLKNKGFGYAKIIYPKRNEKLIKVSAGGFLNESDADLAALKVSESMNQTTWIYKK